MVQLINSQDSISSNWEPLGTTYYKKSLIYSISSSSSNTSNSKSKSNSPFNDLSSFIKVAARFGGPVAIMRDDSKPILITSSSKQQFINSNKLKPKISIYSSSGLLLQSIAWEPSSRIISIGWTITESLVVLTQDGTYRIYPLSPNSTISNSTYTQFNLGSIASESFVHSARIYEFGMVVLLNNFTFLEVKFSESNEESEGIVGGGGKVIELANAGLEVEPDCWCIIEPERSFNGNSSRGGTGIEVIICTRDKVLRLDELEVIDQKVTKGPFLSITPSPNGRFLALLSQPSTSSSTKSSPTQLWVTSIDFTNSLSEFDLSSEITEGSEAGKPNQLVWCGNNTVVVSWDALGLVMMVGPFGETLKYFYEDAVFLIGEIDGTRILSTENCEFLQIVPQSTQDIFLPTSYSPASILYKATELFELKSPKSDEFIRSLTSSSTSSGGGNSDLVLAVDTCLDAAGRELEVYWQKRLLRAATFGKTFLDFYNSTDFLMMTSTLRVLNAVRYFEIGIPLTYDQYQAHPPTQLIKRLTLRSQHLLSIKISEFLSLPPSTIGEILKHWAKEKIQLVKSNNSGNTSSSGNKEREDEVCKIIVEKLKLNRNSSTGNGNVGMNGGDGISCADIAETAWNEGMNGLATKLLNFEPRASKQIPLLINMKEDELALLKSIESGDPDLVYTVLLHLKRTHSLRDFFHFLDKKPEAINLLRVYCKEMGEIELLKDFFYRDDRRLEMALVELESSFETIAFEEKLAKIKLAAKAFNEDKDCSFEAKTIEDQIKLITFQQSLEQEVVGKVFVGSSVNETIKQCILNGLGKKADKLRVDFKVPDKRFWYIKLKALIELRDYISLEAFAKSKKSPIGYVQFVILLLNSGATKQAISYITKCDPGDRVELYVKCGEWVLAGKEAVKRSDRATLIDLRQRSPNAIISAQLDQLYEDLQNSGA